MSFPDPPPNPPPFAHPTPPPKPLPDYLCPRCRETPLTHYAKEENRMIRKEWYEKKGHNQDLPLCLCAECTARTLTLMLDHHHTRMFGRSDHPTRPSDEGA